MSITGVGPSHAKKIMDNLSTGTTPTPGLLRKMEDGYNPFTYLHPAKQVYGSYYDRLPRHMLMYRVTEVTKIKHITCEIERVAFIGCLIKKNLRDVNEVGSVSKRDGVHLKPPTSFLNMMFEDDTDSIFATIWRHDYEDMGEEIAETGKVDKDWYLVIGDIQTKVRKMSIVYIEKITKS